MPTFGQHETAQRLHLSGVGAVYALKSDEKKIIKVLQPPEGIWTEEQLRFEVDGFLLRAKTQRAIAKSSKNWAPVHEISAIRAGTEGSAEGAGGDAMSRAEDSGGTFVAGGAYAILDRYERSCQSLLDGRVNLNNGDLRNLMSSVIRGLIDLRKSPGRPHGNLKPSNILLANSIDLSAAVVHLADPAPDGVLNANSANKDLADLAKILYELVHLRPYQGGTIGPSKEWHKLGPNGEDWRKLCNALLDPGAPPDERDLEKILPQIDTWRAKPKKSKLPLLAAAAALLVIVGGVAVWHVTHQVNWDPDKWKKLCLSYYSWFDDFSRMNDNTKHQFLSDPDYPAQAVKLLNDAGDIGRYDPRKFTGSNNYYEKLAADPPDAAKVSSSLNPLDTPATTLTKNGVDLIDSIAAAMGPKSWPLLVKLDQTAKNYDSLGWTKPAFAIHDIVTRAQPPVIPTTPPDIDDVMEDKLIMKDKSVIMKNVSMADKIKDAVIASKTVDAIDNQWQLIKGEIKQLPETHVPIIDAFPQFAADLPRSAPAASQPGQPMTGTLDDVKALAADFTQIETVLHQLVADLNQKDRQIDFVGLANDPASQLPKDGKLTLAMYSRLPDVIQGYFKLSPSPLAAVDWNHALDLIEKERIQVIKKANPDDAHLSTLIGHRDALKKDLDSLVLIAPIENNRRQLEHAVADARESLDKLTREGNEWVSPYIIRPDEFIQNQTARIAASPHPYPTPAVYSQWQKASTALLEKIKVESKGLQTYPYDVYQNYLAKFQTLDETYAGFEQKIPTPIPGLSSIAGNGWPHDIAQKVAVVDRETAINDLMTNSTLHWSNDLPQVADSGYQSFASRRIQIYDAHCEEARALIADYTAMESQLNKLKLRAQDLTTGETPWRALAAKWKNSASPLLNDKIITDALAPITMRVDNLLALDSLTDYQQLVEKTASPLAEIALTAWRVLGTVSLNESLPFLKDEKTAESHLHDLLNASSKMLDPTLLHSITFEIETQRPLRWRRWAYTLVSAADIQKALDYRTAFGVNTLDAPNDAPLLYDDALYQLNKDVAKNLPEAQLKLSTQRFIDAVSQMPSIAANPNIQTLLNKMKRSLQQNQDDAGSSAGAGPKLAGWDQDLSAGKDHPRFYSKIDPGCVLEFVRIPDQVKGKTVYICTTDVSLRLFADVLNPHVADLDNSKPGIKQHWLKIGNDSWDGPRVWKIDEDGKLVPNNVWLSPISNMTTLGLPYYPANIVQKLEPPGPDMPAQCVSPWVAMYTARLLGCRLPTSTEWIAAYDRIEANAGRKNSWNLRGADWQAQQNYSIKMSTNSMPYADNGIFENNDFLNANNPPTGGDATSWHASDLAKINPVRFSDGPDLYKGSVVWFREVGKEPGKDLPGSGKGAIHDLVGNVAQFVFDDPSPTPLKPTDIHPTTDEIDNIIANTKNALSVIGGSALSPPQMSFKTPQQVDLTLDSTSAGFADVGFRLAYTAPIDSIVDILATAKYLPGSNAK